MFADRVVAAAGAGGCIDLNLVGFSPWGRLLATFIAAEYAEMFVHWFLYQLQLRR